MSVITNDAFNETTKGCLDDVLNELLDYIQSLNITDLEEKLHALKKEQECSDCCAKKESQKDKKCEEEKQPKTISTSYKGVVSTFEFDEEFNDLNEDNASFNNRIKERLDEFTFNINLNNGHIDLGIIKFVFKNVTFIYKFNDVIGHFVLCYVGDGKISYDEIIDLSDDYEKTGYPYYDEVKEELCYPCLNNINSATNDTKCSCNECNDEQCCSCTDECKKDERQKSITDSVTENTTFTVDDIFRTCDEEREKQRENNIQGLVSCIDDIMTNRDFTINTNLNNNKATLQFNVEKLSSPSRNYYSIYSLDEICDVIKKRYKFSRVYYNLAYGEGINDGKKSQIKIYCER